VDGCMYISKQDKHGVSVISGLGLAIFPFFVYGHWSIHRDLDSWPTTCTYVGPSLLVQISILHLRALAQQSVCRFYYGRRMLKKWPSGRRGHYGYPLLACLGLPFVY
jgi:hypothetical protein